MFILLSEVSFILHASKFGYLIRVITFDIRAALNPDFAEVDIQSNLVTMKVESWYFYKATTARIATFETPI